MKDHAQYAETLALYAIGALDNQERAELQEHLGTCGECRSELEALRADAALLALSATGPQPPQRSRQRLLDAVAAEPGKDQRTISPIMLGRSRPRWLTLVPTVGALALAVFSFMLLLQVGRLKDTNAKLAQALKIEQQNSAHAKEVLAMLNDPKAQHMTLVSTHTPPQSQVKTLYQREKGHVLLMASNLEPIPDDRVYELWLLPASGGPPMPCGTFRIDSKGNSMMLHAMETEGIEAKAFAITIEPVGGSKIPTLPIKYAPAS